MKVYIYTDVWKILESSCMNSWSPRAQRVNFALFGEHSRKYMRRLWLENIVTSVAKKFLNFRKWVKWALILIFVTRLYYTLLFETVTTVASCGLWGVICPWFDFWFCCCYLMFPLYRVLPHLSFYSSLFPCLLPYLSFSLRIDPLHFQAGCVKGD